MLPPLLAVKKESSHRRGGGHCTTCRQQRRIGTLSLVLSAIVLFTSCLSPLDTSVLAFATASYDVADNIRRQFSGADDSSIVAPPRPPVAASLPTDRRSDAIDYALLAAGASQLLAAAVVGVEGNAAPELFAFVALLDASCNAPERRAYAAGGGSGGLGGWVMHLIAPTHSAVSLRMRLELEPRPDGDEGALTTTTTPTSSSSSPSSPPATERPRRLVVVPTEWRRALRRDAIAVLGSVAIAAAVFLLQFILVTVYMVATGGGSGNGCGQWLWWCGGCSMGDDEPSPLSRRRSSAAEAATTTPHKNKNRSSALALQNSSAIASSPSNARGRRMNSSFSSSTRYVSKQWVAARAACSRLRFPGAALLVASLLYTGVCVFTFRLLFSAEGRALMGSVVSIGSGSGGHDASSSSSSRVDDYEGGGSSYSTDASLVVAAVVCGLAYALLCPLATLYVIASKAHRADFVPYAKAAVNKKKCEESTNKNINTNSNRRGSGVAQTPADAVVLTIGATPASVRRRQRRGSSTYGGYPSPSAVRGGGDHNIAIRSAILDLDLAEEAEEAAVQQKHDEALRRQRLRSTDVDDGGDEVEATLPAFRPYPAAAHRRRSGSIVVPLSHPTCEASLAQRQQNTASAYSSSASASWSSYLAAFFLPAGYNQESSFLGPSIVFASRSGRRWPEEPDLPSSSSAPPSSNQQQQNASSSAASPSLLLPPPPSRFGGGRLFWALVPYAVSFTVALCAALPSHALRSESHSSSSASLTPMGIGYTRHHYAYALASGDLFTLPTPPEFHPTSTSSAAVTTTAEGNSNNYYATDSLMPPVFDPLPLPNGRSCQSAAIAVTCIVAAALGLLLFSRPFASGLLDTLSALHLCSLLLLSICYVASAPANNGGSVLSPMDADRLQMAAGLLMGLVCGVRFVYCLVLFFLFNCCGAARWLFAAAPPSVVARAAAASSNNRERLTGSEGQFGAHNGALLSPQEAAILAAARGGGGASVAAGGDGGGGDWSPRDNNYDDDAPYDEHDGAEDGEQYPSNNRRRVARRIAAEAPLDDASPSPRDLGLIAATNRNRFGYGDGFSVERRAFSFGYGYEGSVEQQQQRRANNTRNLFGENEEDNEGGGGGGGGAFASAPDGRLGASPRCDSMNLIVGGERVVGFSPSPLRHRKPSERGGGGEGGMQSHHQIQHSGNGNGRGPVWATSSPPPQDASSFLQHNHHHAIVEGFSPSPIRVVGANAGAVGYRQSSVVKAPPSAAEQWLAAQRIGRGNNNRSTNKSTAAPHSAYASPEETHHNAPNPRATAGSPLLQYHQQQQHNGSHHQDDSVDHHHDYAAAAAAAGRLSVAELVERVAEGDAAARVLMGLGGGSASPLAIPAATGGGGGGAAEEEQEAISQVLLLRQQFASASSASPLRRDHSAHRPLSLFSEQPNDAINSTPIGGSANADRMLAYGSPEKVGRRRSSGGAEPATADLGIAGASPKLQAQQLHQQQHSSTHTASAGEIPTAASTANAAAGSRRGLAAAAADFIKERSRSVIAAATLLRIGSSSKIEKRERRRDSNLSAEGLPPAPPHPLMSSAASSFVGPSASSLSRGGGDGGLRTVSAGALTGISYASSRAPSGSLAGPPTAGSSSVNSTLVSNPLISRRQSHTSDNGSYPQPHPHHPHHKQQHLFGEANTDGAAEKEEDESRRAAVVAAVAARVHASNSVRRSSHSYGSGEASAASVDGGGEGYRSFEGIGARRVLSVSSHHSNSSLPTPPTGGGGAGEPITTGAVTQHQHRNIANLDILDHLRMATSADRGAAMTNGNGGAPPASLRSDRAAAEGAAAVGSRSPSLLRQRHSLQQPQSQPHSASSPHQQQPQQKPPLCSQHSSLASASAIVASSPHTQNLAGRKASSAAAPMMASPKRLSSVLAAMSAMANGGSPLGHALAGAKKEE